MFPLEERAENGTRTRDPDLGKVVLYQLSYFRREIKNIYYDVKRRRLELPRHNWHYPLKVARLPIPPPLQHVKAFWIKVPRTGLEPARRETHAPETCASTNSATWASEGKNLLNGVFRMLSGKRDSDPRPQPWQGCALPTELFPQLSFARNISLNAVAKVRLFF